MVCGIEIAAVTPEEAIRLIVEAAIQPRSLQVHLCNAYTLSLVDRDPMLSAALRRSDLNFPDGTPVSWLLRRLGTRGPVRGPSLMRGVARGGADSGLAHYLWGGGPGIADRVAEALTTEDDRIRIAGSECPPYSDLTDGEVVALARRVEDAGAHVLWVGIGTPRQDYITSRLADHLSIPVIPVGAAFDFISGHVHEAPVILHGSGLEWIYRLVREPRRLWRRYVFGNARFATSLLRHRISRR